MRRANGSVNGKDDSISGPSRLRSVWSLGICMSAMAAWSDSLAVPQISAWIMFGFVSVLSHGEFEAMEVKLRYVLFLRAYSDIEFVVALRLCGCHSESSS